VPIVVTQPRVGVARECVCVRERERERERESVCVCVCVSRHLIVEHENSILCWHTHTLTPSHTYVYTASGGFGRIASSRRVE